MSQTVLKRTGSPMANSELPFKKPVPMSLYKSKPNKYLDYTFFYLRNPKVVAFSKPTIICKCEDRKDGYSPQRISVGPIHDDDRQTLQDYHARMVEGFTVPVTSVLFPLPQDEPNARLFMNCQFCTVFNRGGDRIPYAELPVHSTGMIAITLLGVKIKNGTSVLLFNMRATQIMVKQETKRLATKLLFPVEAVDEEVDDDVADAATQEAEGLKSY